MAEFVEVVEKKKEICAYHKICEACPLCAVNNSHGVGCESFMLNYPQEAEKNIMAWEKTIDWSKVEVDTPILVKHYENEDWVKRYFAKYEAGIVFAWVNGTTSWSSEENIVGWRYAKLAEDNK